MATVMASTTDPAHPHNDPGTHRAHAPTRPRKPLVRPHAVDRISTTDVPRSR
jgi:hypothetical protein